MSLIKSISNNRHSNLLRHFFSTLKVCLEIYFKKFVDKDYLSLSELRGEGGEGNFSGGI